MINIKCHGNFVKQVTAMGVVMNAGLEQTQNRYGITINTYDSVITINVKKTKSFYKQKLINKIRT